MPVQGDPLDLSDDELEANAEVRPERDLPLIREWVDRYVPSPFDTFFTAREDPNDPALPENQSPE